jgi:hypothetical protein
MDHIDLIDFCTKIINYVKPHNYCVNLEFINKEVSIFNNPYNTLEEAVKAASDEGKISVSTDSAYDRLTGTKNLFLKDVQKNSISKNTNKTDINQIKGNMECEIQEESSGNHLNMLWDNGPWTCWGGGNCRGENTIHGKYWLEIADDFIVEYKNWTVINGHFEGLCNYGNLQVDSVLVRFFNDLGDLPIENPFYEFYSIKFDVTDYYNESCGWYHTKIDVKFGPVLLTPGRYWIQFTPIGCAGNWHYQAYTDQNYGADCAHRDGDPSYGGGYGNYTWIHFTPETDVSFKLTGYIGIPPTQPEITGPKKEASNTQHKWTFHSSDPDGYDVKYFIDWGDNNTEWTDFFSDSTPKDVNHNYTFPGTYIIRAYAEDEDGNVGPEGTYVVAMPKDKVIKVRVLQFLQNHTNLYLII